MVSFLKKHRVIITSTALCLSAGFEYFRGDAHPADLDGCGLLPAFPLYGDGSYPNALLRTAPGGQEGAVTESGLFVSAYHEVVLYPLGGNSVRGPHDYPLGYSTLLPGGGHDVPRTAPERTTDWERAGPGEGTGGESIHPRARGNLAPSGHFLSFRGTGGLASQVHWRDCR